MEYNIVNHNLNTLKHEYNLRVSDMAEIAGIPVSTMSNYLKAREPSYDVLIAFSRHFNVTLDWLLGESDFRNADEKEDMESMVAIYGDSSAPLEDISASYYEGLFYELSSIIREFRRLANNNDKNSFADGLYLYDEILCVLRSLHDYLLNINQNVYDNPIDTVTDIGSFLQDQKSHIEDISAGLSYHNRQLLLHCAKQMNLSPDAKQLLMGLFNYPDDRK